MLDNQYSRVIRWVNRAQSMSAGGKYSDAILDVECARAELDDARQELLLCHKAGSERKKIPTPALAAITAICAVFFMASPLQIALLPTDIAVQNFEDGASIQMGPGAEAATEQNMNVLFAGELPSDTLGFESGEHLSERDVYHLIEVGRNALQKGEGTLVLDFN